MVSSRPGCPAYGESCHISIRWHLSPLSGGTISLSDFLSFQKGPVTVSFHFASGYAWGLSSTSWYFCWVWETMFSGDPVESVSARLMKALLGSICMSWLSFFPSSDPGGQDSASAAEWSLPGTCSIVK